MSTENENRAPEEMTGAEEINENSPAPDGKKPKKSGGITGGYLARLVITLALVCAVIAALLATVNAVTKNKIDEHKLESQKKAVFEVFPGAADCDPYEEETGHDVYVVYGDKEKKDIVGYAVKVAPVGFGGEIEMMVGIGADGKTTGVSVITMSETPGVGTKTNSESFLSRFKGKDGSVAVGVDVDAVTGATISSKAITAGVREAHGVKVDLEEFAAGKGAAVDSSAEAEPAPEATKEPQETKNPQATKEPQETKEPEKEPESASDETAEPGDEPEFRENGSDGYYHNGVYTSDTDDAYQVEVGKDEYESLLEKEDDPETGTDSETKEP